MLDAISDKLDIPASCEVNSTVFKKLFYENAQMNRRDKKIFAEGIEKIIWLYSFKEDTINLQPYKDTEIDYEEVAVIQVMIEEGTKTDRIAEIIQRTIPYPLILIFTRGNRVMLNAAHKHINRADENKNTAEEFIFTDWMDLGDLSPGEKQFIESLNIKNLSFVNCYRFYSDIVDRLMAFNASGLTGNFEDLLERDTDEVKSFYDKIENMNIKLAELRRDIKKEANFNRKVEINIKIKKLEAKRDKLIQEMRVIK